MIERGEGTVMVNVAGKEYERPTPLRGCLAARGLNNSGQLSTASPRSTDARIAALTFSASVGQASFRTLGI
jgi:hypothetical protein